MANMQQDKAKSEATRYVPDAPSLAQGERPPPPLWCGVSLVGMWCVERKRWDQHESAGDQLIDVTRY